jgi:hypothetical protein
MEIKKPFGCTAVTNVSRTSVSQQPRSANVLGLPFTSKPPTPASPQLKMEPPSQPKARQMAPSLDKSEFTYRPHHLDELYQQTFTHMHDVCDRYYALVSSALP